MAPKNTKSSKPAKPAAARALDAANKAAAEGQGSRREKGPKSKDKVTLALEAAESVIKSAKAIGDAIKLDNIELAAASCFLGYSTVCLADRTDLDRGPIIDIRQWNMRTADKDKIEDFTKTLGENYCELRPLAPEHAVILGVRRETIDIGELTKNWTPDGLKPIKWLAGVKGKEGLALLINGNHRRTIMEIVTQPLVQRIKRIDSVLLAQTDHRSDKIKAVLDSRNEAFGQLADVGRWAVKVYNLDAIEAHRMRDQIKFHLAENPKVWQAVDSTNDYLRMIFPLIRDMKTSEEVAAFIHTQTSKGNPTRGTRSASNPTMLWHVARYLFVPAVSIRKPFSANFLNDSKDTPSPFLEALLFEGYCQFTYLCIDVDAPPFGGIQNEACQTYKKKIRNLAQSGFSNYIPVYHLLDRDFIDECERRYMEHFGELSGHFGSQVKDHQSGWVVAMVEYKKDLYDAVGEWIKELKVGIWKEHPTELKLLDQFMSKLEWILDGAIFDHFQIGIHFSEYHKPIIVPALPITVGNRVHETELAYLWQVFTHIEPLYAAILTEHNKGSGRAVSGVLRKHFLNEQTYNRVMSGLLGIRDAQMHAIHKALKGLPNATFGGVDKPDATDEKLMKPLLKFLSSIMVATDSEYPDEVDSNLARKVVEVTHGKELIRICEQTKHPIFHATFEKNKQVVNSACKYKAQRFVLNTFKLMHEVWIPALTESNVYATAYDVYQNYIEEPHWLKDKFDCWYVMKPPPAEEQRKRSAEDFVNGNACVEVVEMLRTQTERAVRMIVDAISKDEGTLVKHSGEGSSEMRIVPDIYDAAQHLINEIVKHHIRVSDTMLLGEGKTLDPAKPVPDNQVRAKLASLDVPRLPRTATPAELVTCFSHRPVLGLDDRSVVSEVKMYERQKKKNIRMEEEHARLEENLRKSKSRARGPSNIANKGTAEQEFGLETERSNDQEMSTTELGREITRAEQGDPDSGQEEEAEHIDTDKDMGEQVCEPLHAKSPPEEIETDKDQEQRDTNQGVSPGQDTMADSIVPDSQEDGVVAPGKPGGGLVDGGEGPMQGVKRTMGMMESVGTADGPFKRLRHRREQTHGMDRQPNITRKVPKPLIPPVTTPTGAELVPSTEDQVQAQNQKAKRIASSSQFHEGLANDTGSEDEV